MEPKKKLNTILVINALFQLTNDIGKKQKINTDKESESGEYLSQDTWQEPIYNICLKVKGNFIYNYKLKKFEHMSETPVHGNFYRMQSIKKELFKHELK